MPREDTRKTSSNEKTGQHKPGTVEEGGKRNTSTTTSKHVDGVGEGYGPRGAPEKQRPVIGRSKSIDELRREARHLIKKIFVKKKYNYNDVVNLLALVEKVPDAFSEQDKLLEMVENLRRLTQTIDENTGTHFVYRLLHAGAKPGDISVILSTLTKLGLTGRELYDFIKMITASDEAIRRLLASVELFKKIRERYEKLIDNLEKIEEKEIDGVEFREYVDIIRYLDQDLPRIMYSEYVLDDDVFDAKLLANELHVYRYADRSEPKTPWRNVVLIVDKSGSTSNILSLLAAMAVAIIAWYRRKKLNTKLYVFDGKVYGPYTSVGKMLAILLLSDSGGCTAVDEAVKIAIRDVPKKRTHVIVLTDGEFPSYVDNVIIEEARKLDVKTSRLTLVETNYDFNWINGNAVILGRVGYVFDPQKAVSAIVSHCDPKKIVEKYRYHKNG